MAKATPRRKSREAALQALFMLEINPESEIKSIAEFIESYEEAKGLDLSYAEMLFRGVNASRTNIDLLISTQSENWKIERISNIEKNILRIAAWELLNNPDIDSAVAISEAIEISKKFATEDSIPFINGILDGILKSK